MSEPTNQNNNIKINLPKDDSVLQYSNVVIVNHSLEEFVVDFGRGLPGNEQVDIKSRIVLTPRNAKLFAELLVGHVKHYEETFGEITMPQNAQAPTGPQVVR